MITFNWLIIFIAALVPLIVGFIWYNPKVFGNAWMNSIGMTRDSMQGGNMAKVFILTFIYSFLVAMFLNFIVIHQMHLFSILANDLKDANSPAHADLKNFMDKYGDRFRTFKHGAFHGTLGGIFFILPVIAINAMFEKRGAKYILINAGFWIVCLLIMGGLICQFT